ncbi:MAG TPA: glycosyltransferase [Methanoregulaceae archaeon]|nr:glycosyltransferase [Methanolinea sp.]HPD11320.1 glycosyltransferase [Methanoregulaceae archaeon]
MKVLLLANQPASTIRLQLFRETLFELGYEVVVPTFSSRNWLTISRDAKRAIMKEQPDIIHLFNVPDILYRKIPSLKKSHFNTLVYDYRSPWGVEYQMNFGRLARWTAEYFERHLALCADAITTVNTPLSIKVQSYLDDGITPISIIPNYPKKSFSPLRDSTNSKDNICSQPILFVGRVCTQEGIQNFIRLSRELPELNFWLVGDGPFSWWYLKNKPGNLTHFGWQPHEKVAEFIGKSKICLIPREENPLTSYSTDKSVWKLNEYLNLGKIVIASGISPEEPRKNLIVVKKDFLKETILSYAEKEPEPLESKDLRFWEDNTTQIKKVYEKL